jgi:polyribonucleotide nucleotidyltransferase
VKDAHGRSIRSTTLTIAGYLQEIKMLLSEDVSDGPGSRFTPGERKAVATALSNMETIIERYRDEFNFSKGEIDVKWKVLVLAEAMENLVHDMGTDRLDKKYGQMDSAGERRRIGELQEELREQIRRLKDVSARSDRSLR